MIGNQSSPGYVDNWAQQGTKFARELAGKATEATKALPTPEDRLAAAVEFAAKGAGWSDRSALEALAYWNADNQQGWAKEDLSHRIEEAIARHKAQEVEAYRAAERAEQKARAAAYDAMIAEHMAQHKQKAIAAAKTDFQFVEACDLKEDGSDQTPWLINDVLREKEPCIFAGPEKCLKTSVGLDLAVSLASGERFLDWFVVPEQVRVAMFTGESSRATIVKKMHLICGQKQTRLSNFSLNLHLGFRLPKLSDPVEREKLGLLLRSYAIRLVIIDPLYLCLLAGQGEEGRVQASNRHQMGPLFRSIAETCLDAGATPVLIDHTRKNPGHRPLGLGDLAWTGPAEFARQWIFVNHRRPYDLSTGTTKFWLTLGGSAGHCGEWKVDVTEGVLTSEHDGRKWEITDIRPSGRSSQGEAGRKNQADGLSADEVKILAAIDQHAAEKKQTPSRTAVRRSAGLNTKTAKEATAALIEKGMVELIPIEVTAGKGARRKATGLQRLVAPRQQKKHPQADEPDDR